MSDRDTTQYITAAEAARRLNVSIKTVHRMGERSEVRIRRTGRFVMFSVDDIEERARDLDVQRGNTAPEEVDQLRQRLEQATYRVGYLEAQLERRLLPDHEQEIRTELATVRTERDIFAQQLQKAQAPWRLWLVVGLLILVAILVTYIVVRLL